jgi:alpha-glucosidase
MVNEINGRIAVPLGSGAQENVLCLDLDPYAGEDILMHEFAHTIHNLGLVPTYPDFQAKLDAAFENTKTMRRWANAGADGLGGDTYALTDAWEYFAEGVQSWFNVNQQPNASHNQVDTRAELQSYDPELYDLIATYFSPDTRACSCHAHQDAATSSNSTRVNRCDEKSCAPFAH